MLTNVRQFVKLLWIFLIWKDLWNTSNYLFFCFLPQNDTLSVLANLIGSSINDVMLWGGGKEDRKIVTVSLIAVYLSSFLFSLAYDFIYVLHTSLSTLNIVDFEKDWKLFFSFIISLGEHLFQDNGLTVSLFFFF